MSFMSSSTAVSMTSCWEKSGRYVLVCSTLAPSPVWSLKRLLNHATPGCMNLTLDRQWRISETIEERTVWTEVVIFSLRSFSLVRVGQTTRPRLSRCAPDRDARETSATSHCVTSQSTLPFYRDFPYPLLPDRSVPVHTSKLIPEESGLDW